MKCHEEALVYSFCKYLLSTYWCWGPTWALGCHRSAEEVPEDTCGCEQAPLKLTGARGCWGAVLEGARCPLLYRGGTGGHISSGSRAEQASSPAPRAHPWLPQESGDSLWGW